MLAKEITYTDLNGNSRTDTYYFNLTKAELLEYDSSFEEGVLNYLAFLTKNGDKMKGKLVLAFKDLILRSYGEKTPNGRFIKNDELREAFAASEPYSELFMEITASEENAANFINAIIPQVPDSDKPDKEILPANVTSMEPPVG